MISDMKTLKRVSIQLPFGEYEYVSDSPTSLSWAHGLLFHFDFLNGTFPDKMRCIRANSANKITADSTSSLVSVHTLWLCLVFSAVAISLCASFSMEPTYPLAPIANLIACALVVIPLFRMANAPWNTGVYAFALYLVLQSLSTGVNTIVWSRDAVNRAPCGAISVLCFQLPPAVYQELKTWLKHHICKSLSLLESRRARSS